VQFLSEAILLAPHPGTVVPVAPAGRQAEPAQAAL
jgi:hypothetical protein